MDHRRVLDVLERVLGLELRVRVVDRVLVVLPADPRVVLGLRAVLLHVVAAGVAEHLRRERRSSRGRGARTCAPCACRAPGVRSVYFIPSEPRSIFSKPIASAQSIEPALDRLAREQQRARARRAVVVDVQHRDPGQAELVDGALAVGRVAVHVAGVRLLDRVVGDAGVLRAPSRRPPWPSRGSRPPSCRACRTSSSRRRSRRSCCSSSCSFGAPRPGARLERC